MGRRATGLLGAALALNAALGRPLGGDDSGERRPGQPGAIFARAPPGQLKEGGALQVGTKFDQPLFGLKNLEGNPEGFDVEIAKLIAGEMGIAADKVKFIEAVSANREPFIQQDKVDFVVATYTINDKRKEVVDFAGPYYEAGQDIMVTKGNPEGIGGPDDLAGKKVCSVTGSTRPRTPDQLPQGRADRVRRLLQCARLSERPCPGRDHRQRHPAWAHHRTRSPSSWSATFTKEPYGIGSRRATRVPHFITTPLRRREGRR